MDCRRGNFPETDTRLFARAAVLVAAILWLVLMAPVANAAPGTFVVTSKNISGPGSFDAAMTAAAANGSGVQTLTFNIPGPGVQTIVIEHGYDTNIELVID